MRPKAISGFNSIFIGAIGLVIVIGGLLVRIYCPSPIDIGFLKNPPPGGEVEARAPGLQSFTDVSAA